MHAIARSVPVLIGALAAILGIGGIAQKVKSFFQALAKPIMKAVDWVVGKIVALGKKTWAKLKAAISRRRAASKRGDRQPAGSDTEQNRRADLERARRELPPKIRNVLAKGVSSSRLQSMLGRWRQSYRLRVLEVRPEGGNAKIVVANSPETDLIKKLIEANSGLLHEQVRKVAPEVARDSKVREALRELREQRKASFQAATAKTTTSSGTDPRSSVTHTPGPAGVAAAALDVATNMRVGADGPGRPPRTIEQHQYGDDAALTAREQQGRHQGPGSVLVTIDPHSYSEMLNQYPPNAGQPLGEAMLRIQSQGKLDPTALPPGITLGQAVGLTRLFQVEAGRNLSAYPVIPMVVYLLAHGKLPLSQGLAHQMSDVGAMDIARRANESHQRERRAAVAKSQGLDPNKRDLKKPWTKDRVVKDKQGLILLQEPWERAVERYFRREQETVIRTYLG